MRRLAAALLLAAGSAQAARGPGGAAAVLARLPFGARELALGGDHGTLPRDPVAFLANPAALAGLDALVVSAALHQGPDGVTWNGLAGGTPILPWLAAGGVIETLSAGDIEAWDYAGARHTADLETDRVIGGAAAAALGPFAAGVGFRHFHSSLVGKRTASAMLVDLGATWRWERPGPPGLPRSGASPDWFACSAAATGLGPSVDYGGASDQPPLTWRLGLAAGRDLGGRRRGLVAVALDVPRETARPRVHGGVELAVPAGPVAVALRAGARYRRDGGVLSAGAGAAFRGLGVDYAFLSADDPFGPTHHVSLTFSLEGLRTGSVPAPEE